MPEDRTVLEHLLDGRDALVLEVQRLTTAIEELDSVIARISGGERRLVPSAATTIASSSMPAPPPAAPAWIASADSGRATSRPVTPELEVETFRPATANDGNDGSSHPRRSAARTTSFPAAAPAESPAPTSIRLFVLDMLASENREFGLAELIDGVHDAGIQAHDDAVRSITIKLMKDGKVERVGRGQYKLAHRASRTSGSRAARSGSSVTSHADSGLYPAVDTPARVEAPAETATVVSGHDETTGSADVLPPTSGGQGSNPTVAGEAPLDEASPGRNELSLESVPAEALVSPTLPDAGADVAPDAPVAEPSEDGAAEEATLRTPTLETPAGDTVSREHEPDQQEPTAPPEAARAEGGYTPPLNLGQPWTR